MQAAQDTTFRQTLSRFTTGVCVVVAQEPGASSPIGMTINAFTSVSLDPPLILFCLKKDAKRTPSFMKAKRFAISVLCDNQEDLSRHFAREASLDWDTHAKTPLPHFPPFLTGAAAHIACETYDVHEAGDHFIVVARVTHVDFDAVRAPLAYFASTYARLENSPLASSLKASETRSKVTRKRDTRGPLTHL